MLERVGGGFVESPTKGSSPIHVVGRATSDDLLTRLERDLHDSHAIISDQQLQIASLSSEVSRRGATLEAHSRARGALQAEVDEARRYMAQSATQLASLRAAYGSSPMPRRRRERPQPRLGEATCRGGGARGGAAARAVDRARLKRRTHRASRRAARGRRSGKRSSGVTTPRRAG